EATGYESCYIKRQPESPDEVERAIMAMAVGCCGAHRYGGRDPQSLHALWEAGIDASQLDHPPAEGFPERTSPRFMPPEELHRLMVASELAIKCAVAGQPSEAYAALAAVLRRASEAADAGEAWGIQLRDVLRGQMERYARDQGLP